VPDFFAAGQARQVEGAKQQGNGEAADEA